MIDSRTVLAATSIAIMSFTAPAFANDKESVQVFYDLLSNPGSEDLVGKFLDVTSENWESVGDYSNENKRREGFLKQVGGMAKFMPDVEWAVQAMHQDGNFITVRSRATATPAGPFRGVDGQGRSFDIMTIDIHELKDGKIVRTYHVEDWAGALQQLAGE